jgi:hypothetical protein
VAVLFETGIFVGTRVAHIIIWSNMRRFSCCVAAALSFAQVAAANAEDEGKWELEQHGGAAFALSYKQSASISNQIATSELGFLCDRRSRGGVIGTILVPFDGTFESHQDPIPVSIQQKPDEYGPSDLLQKWKNESEFLFSDVKDDVPGLITLLKEKDTDADRSVHFYFPNGLGNGQRTSNHIVVDASGFAGKFEEFDNHCTSGQ